MRRTCENGVLDFDMMNAFSPRGGGPMCQFGVCGYGDGDYGGPSVQTDDVGHIRLRDLAFKMLCDLCARCGLDSTRYLFAGYSPDSPLEQVSGDWPAGKALAEAGIRQAYLPGMKYVPRFNLRILREYDMMRELSGLAGSDAYAADVRDLLDAFVYVAPGTGSFAYMLDGLEAAMQCMPADTLRQFCVAFYGMLAEADVREYSGLATKPCVCSACVPVSDNGAACGDEGAAAGGDGPEEPGAASDDGMTLAGAVAGPPDAGAEEPEPEGDPAGAGGPVSGEFDIPAEYGDVPADPAGAEEPVPEAEDGGAPADTSVSAEPVPEAEDSGVLADAWAAEEPVPESTAGGAQADNGDDGEPPHGDDDSLEAPVPGDENGGEPADTDGAEDPVPDDAGGSVPAEPAAGAEPPAEPEPPAKSRVNPVPVSALIGTDETYASDYLSDQYDKQLEQADATGYLDAMVASRANGTASPIDVLSEVVKKAADASAPTETRNLREKVGEMAREAKDASGMEDGD